MQDDVAVIADLHCGHKAGLTPPDWQYREGSNADDFAKFGPIQREVWKWFEAKATALGPVETLVVDGDAIDGNRSSPTELITADRREQIRMAAAVIGVFQAKRVYIIRGTPRHVGDEEDWETLLGDAVHAAKVGNHEWIERDGVIMDIKHKVGNSTIPHGRGTPLGRAALWNALWAERGLQPRANILVRGHVHSYNVLSNADRTAMTAPCFQWWSKFGSLACEGTIDIGFLTFSLLGEGRFQWTAHLMDMRWAAALTLPM